MPSDAGGWRALVEDHHETLLRSWADAAGARLHGRVTRQEVERDGRELFAALRAAAATGQAVGSEAYDELRAVLTDLSRSRARAGLTPSDTAMSVFALKDALLSVITAAGDRDGQALSDFVDFSGVVDALALFTFESYVQARERVIGDQADQLMELSTPVVKLWEGVVAVPLVGTLDSARTQVVMEKLLQTLVDTGSEHAIIDITGVPAVDTQVAQHLLKTVVAARLMGAQCVISGIRPQIAQTIVALGIEFGDIPTKATLADALVLAMSRVGVDVVRRDAGTSSLRGAVG